MGKGGFWHPGQDNSTGEGDNHPQLEIPNHAPGSLGLLLEADAPTGKVSGCPQEATDFACKHNTPLVAFLDVGASIRGNGWDVL